MMKKVLFALFLVLIMLVTIVGCTSSPSTQATTPPPTSQATTTSAPAPTTSGAPAPTTAQPSSAVAPTSTAPAPTSQIKRGGTLRIANAQAPGTLGDPGSTLKSDQVMRCPALERLGEFNGSAQLEPFLADSWQSDSQAKTFTVKLKQGINFHDNTPFNATAVKWNWDRLKAAKHPDLDGVTAINILDEYTVQVILAKWDNSIVYKLIYDAGGMVSPTAWAKNGEAWGKLNPVGTGPFRLSDYVAGTSVTYEAWNGYWQKGKPYLDGIEFEIIPDQSNRMATFQSGGVDIVINMTALEAKTIAATSKYKISDLKTGIGTGEWVICSQR